MTARGFGAGSGRFSQAPLEFRKQPLLQPICDAAIAVRALSLAANQRTNPVGLAADGIQRIEACQLDVEFGLGILVEEFERLSRAVVPCCRRFPGLQPTRFKCACNNRVMSG